MRVAVAVLLASTLTAACASSSLRGGDGRIQVVASTDVWGDVVHQVAGDAADVTSIIDDPAQDPHSYEAGPQTRLAFARAQLVVRNGGGYDDFVQTMLDADDTGVPVLDAVSLSGRSGNEHVWYDFASVGKTAAAIADQLAALRPADARTFHDNAATFLARLHDLQAREASIAARARGAGVVVTEPVPLYLLAACGLRDRTPAAFSAAIEEGSGVAPRVLSQVLTLLSSHAVRLLVYNEQASGPETERAIAAAHAAAIPAVGVTETVPRGLDYLSWMGANLDAVQQAVLGT